MWDCNNLRVSGIRFLVGFHIAISMAQRINEDTRLIMEIRCLFMFKFLILGRFQSRRLALSLVATIMSGVERIQRLSCTYMYSKSGKGTCILSSHLKPCRKRKSLFVNSAVCRDRSRENASKDPVYSHHAGLIQGRPVSRSEIYSLVVGC